MRQHRDPAPRCVGEQTDPAVFRPASAVRAGGGRVEMGGGLGEAEWAVRSEARRGELELE